MFPGMELEAKAMENVSPLIGSAEQALSLARSYSPPPSESQARVHAAALLRMEVIRLRDGVLAGQFCALTSLTWAYRLRLELALLASTAEPDQQEILRSNDIAIGRCIGTIAGRCAHIRLDGSSVSVPAKITGTWNGWTTAVIAAVDAPRLFTGLKVVIADGQAHVTVPEMGETYSHAIRDGQITLDGGWCLIEA